MLDAARIALLGYEGPLMTTALGPATLAGATFLQSGERTLGDPGAVRDLPMLLAEGLVEHLGIMAERVPGARQHVLLREDAVAAVHEGRIPTPSGRRRYDPLPAPEVGMLWRILMVALEDYGLEPESVTVGVGADLHLLRAARDAAASAAWPSLRAACRRCPPTPGAPCGRASPRPATTAPCSSWSWIRARVATSVPSWR